MPTLIEHPFDQAAGTVANAAAIGASLVSGTGGTRSIVTGGVHGNCLEQVSAAGAQKLARFAFAASNLTVSTAFWVQMPATTPTEFSRVLGLVNVGGSTPGSINLGHGTGIILQVAGSGGTGQVTLASSLTAGAWYRVVSSWVVGASTSTGKWTVKVFNAAGTQVGSTVTTTTANLGTTAITHVDVGVVSAAATVWTVRIDELQLHDGVETEIPVWAPSEPLDTPAPTVTGTTNPSTFGATDGSITIAWPSISGAATYAVSLDSGTTVASATATSPHTFTGLGAGTYGPIAVQARP